MYNHTEAKRMCLLLRTAGVGHQDGRYIFADILQAIAMDAVSGRGSLFLIVNCSQN